MTHHALMKTIASTFESFGLDVTTSQGDGAVQYEAALVMLGGDEHDRPHVLQALLFSQQMFSSAEALQASAPKELGVLSFIVTNPALVPKERFPEVMRLLGLVNKATPFGFVNLSEPENATYYTYSLPIFNEAPKEIELLTVLQTALFVKDSFFPIIEDVANGKSTVEQLISEGMTTTSFNG